MCTGTQYVAFVHPGNFAAFDLFAMRLYGIGDTVKHQIEIIEFHLLNKGSEFVCSSSFYSTNSTDEFGGREYFSER